MSIPAHPLLSHAPAESLADIVPNGTTIRIVRHEVPDGSGACGAQDIVEAVDAQGNIVARVGSGRPRIKLDGHPMPCELHQEELYQAGIRAGRRIAEAAIGIPILDDVWGRGERDEAAAQERRRSQPHWSPTGDHHTETSDVSSLR